MGEEYYKFYCQRAQLKTERTRDLKDRFKATGATTSGGPGSHMGVNLYVKNLDDEMTDQRLNDLFKQFGTITSAKIMTDDRGRCKGFGFVCYKSPDEATKAVTEMHLKVHKGKPLYVGLAEKKDERTARLAQRYKSGGAPFAGAPGNPLQSSPFNPMGGKGGKGNSMMQPPMPGAGMYPQMGGPMGYPPMMPGGTAGGKGGPGGQMNYPPNMMMGPRPGMMGYPGAPMGMPPMGGPMMGAKGQMPPMGGPMMGAKGQMMMGGPGRPPMGNLAPGGKAMPGRPPMNNMPGQGGPVRNPDEPLTASALAAAPPGMQKQMLGEKLFPRISKFQPELAGKITGMMLEMDNSELLMLLESDMQLKNKVDEAMKVLDSLKK